VTIEEATNSIDRSSQSIQELFLEILVDIKNDINYIQGIPLVTTSSLLTTNTPNIIKFGVVKPFVFKNKTIEDILEIDANNLTSTDEDRITKLFNRGYLRRLK